MDGSDTAIAVFAISEPEEETHNPISGTICRLENYSVPCLESMESMSTVIRLPSVVSIYKIFHPNLHSSKILSFLSSASPGPDHRPAAATSDKKPSPGSDRGRLLAQL